MPTASEITAAISRLNKIGKNTNRTTLDQRKRNLEKLGIVVGNKHPSYKAAKGRLELKEKQIEKNKEIRELKGRIYSSKNIREQQENLAKLKTILGNEHNVYVAAKKHIDNKNPPNKKPEKPQGPPFGRGITKTRAQQILNKEIQERKLELRKIANNTNLNMSENQINKLRQQINTLSTGLKNNNINQKNARNKLGRIIAQFFLKKPRAHGFSPLNRPQPLPLPPPPRGGPSNKAAAASKIQAAWRRTAAAMRAAENKVLAGVQRQNKRRAASRLAEEEEKAAANKAAENKVLAAFQRRQKRIAASRLAEEEEKAAAEKPPPLPVKPKPRPKKLLPLVPFIREEFNRNLENKIARIKTELVQTPNNKFILSYTKNKRNILNKNWQKRFNNRKQKIENSFKTNFKTDIKSRLLKYFSQNKKSSLWKKAGLGAAGIVLGPLAVAGGAAALTLSGIYEVSKMLFRGGYATGLEITNMINSIQRQKTISRVQQQQLQQLREAHQIPPNQLPNAMAHGNPGVQAAAAAAAAQILANPAAPPTAKNAALNTLKNAPHNAQKIAHKIIQNAPIIRLAGPNIRLRSGAINLGGQNVRTGTQRVNTGNQNVRTGGQRVNTGNQNVRTGGQRANTGNQSTRSGSQRTNTGNQSSESVLIRNAGGISSVRKGITALEMANGNTAKARSISGLPLNTFVNIKAMGGIKKAKTIVHRRKTKKTKKKRVVRPSCPMYTKNHKTILLSILNKVKKENLKKQLVKVLLKT
jgi:hypothetical protein